MVSSSIFRIASKLVILVLFCIGLWLLSGRTSSIQQTKPAVSLLPVEVKQLNEVAGVIPVELRCLDAELSSPRSIEKLTCIIKNNTTRFITAGTVEITINIERNGSILELRSYYTLDTLLHSDFREDHSNNRIPPGGEHPINELPSSYSDGVVKSIAVGIDYIDFGDNEPAGLNRKGSQIIGDMREGASKYKRWLIKKYGENGKSIDAIIALLNTDPSSQEVGLANSNQESGADMFRKYLLRDYKTNGAERLTKHLNK